MTTSADIPFQINRLAEDGTKIQIHAGVLNVPQRGAGRIVVEDAAGQIIEVNLELASEQLDPSVSVVTTAQASDTSDLTEWIGPDDFAELPPLGAEPPAVPRSLRLTSGFFPVDVSQGEFAPPFTYELLLLASNFANAPASVDYVLNWARPLFRAKIPLQQGQVTAEPGTAAQVLFNNVAGKTVEMHLAFQGEALVPTLAVIRTDPSDQSTELILWVAATDFAQLPPANENDQAA